MSLSSEGEIKKCVGRGRGAKPLANGSTNYGSFIFSGSRLPPAAANRKSLLMCVKLFEKLLSGKVDFLVLGGAAVSIHGFSRMTNVIARSALFSEVAETF
jgi:hypothetical protein